MAAQYKFTFGPWNISTGSDPFGPPVRAEVPFARKIGEYKKLGFDGVQFHDGVGKHLYRDSRYRW